MSRTDKDVRFGDAREMASAWQSFANGNVHLARIEAKKVLESQSASAAAKKEATDLLQRTSVDRAHIYAAVLVACVWLVIVALVYLR